MMANVGQGPHWGLSFSRELGFGLALLLPRLFLMFPAQTLCELAIFLSAGRTADLLQVL
jgi:hypothetical protein